MLSILLNNRMKKNFLISHFICLGLFFVSLPSIALIEKKNFFLRNPFSDLPLVHNPLVHQWVKFFKTHSSDRFRKWLERSYCYAPIMKRIFSEEGLPEDLIYMAMIESGFSSKAVSSAKAVGYWQFIGSTGLRFGLRRAYWLDERKDFEKSTYAASQYLKFLYNKFGDWFLAAAAYNMGENKLLRLIEKYNTKNFWHLSKKYDFPHETAHYVPQLIAAITIAKAPQLHGFNYLRPKKPYVYESFYVPGGINLRKLARHIQEPYRKIRQLNPSLLSEFIPADMENWRVRIPKGSIKKVSQFINTSLL